MRISTAAVQQAALMDLMRAQRDLAETGAQVSSGKKGPDFKSYGFQSETITATRAAKARVESYAASLERLENRLAVQDLAFEELSDIASELRTALTTTDGTFLMTDVEGLFQRAREAINTRSASGGYIFGGTRADAPPFAANTLADLAAAPSAASQFENSNRIPTARTDDATVLEVGFLADDVAGDLMEAFRQIEIFDTGPNGPFNGQTTPAQSAFLQTELGNIIGAFDRINERQAQNGALQKNIEKTITSYNLEADFFQTVLADLEEVDIAEAATRFQQAQTAVEVSAQTFSILSQTSLLPFLR